MIPDPLRRTVKIPIKIVNGYPCLFPEGRLPELKDGTIGDLIVPADAFVDGRVAAQYNQERKAAFLPQGTRLMAQINPDKVPASHRDHLSTSLPGFPGAGVAFELMDDQMILLRETKNSALLPCKCWIPSLNQDAKSINHAYTLISQEYEPHRISHTGNVFSKVYYDDDSSNRWKPLKARRGH